MPIPLSHLLPVPGSSKLNMVALPLISMSSASLTTSSDSEGTENLNRPQPLFPSVGLLHPSSTWIPGSACRTWVQQHRVSVPLVMGPLCLCFSITLRPKPHYLSLLRALQGHLPLSMLPLLQDTGLWTVSLAVFSAEHRLRFPFYSSLPQGTSQVSAHLPSFRNVSLNHNV